MKFQLSRFRKLLLVSTSDQALNTYIDESTRNFLLRIQLANME